MTPYEQLLAEVYYNGTDAEDRTGTGTRSQFGALLRFDLSNGFPLITTKRVHWPSIVHELLWFISGDTNTKYLTDNGVRIWNEWADGDGNLGPVYGRQWRNFGGVDQLRNLIQGIKDNPSSRRHIVSAWNPVDLPDMALPPCHMLFQVYVRDGKLSLSMYQRSADLFLGVPFNIASYSLLAMMIANECGLELGEYVHFIGDAHIYHNHFEQVKEQLSRTPYDWPEVALPKGKKVLDMTYEDIQLMDYKSHPLIKGQVSV